jgi:hypothetical protein
MSVSPRQPLQAAFGLTLRVPHMEVRTQRVREDENGIGWVAGELIVKRDVGEINPWHGWLRIGLRGCGR